MFSLNLKNGVLHFKDIKKENLPQILRWYNKVDEFRFATGVDEPISLEKLTQKYAEVSICSTEFFVGIYLNKENRMIGILKGSLKYIEKDAIWINSLVIDTGYQHYGYGSSAIDMLLSYLKENYEIRNVYLGVVEENIQGRSFWRKNSFLPLRVIESHIKMQNKWQNVIIMYRKL